MLFIYNSESKKLIIGNSNGFVWHEEGIDPIDLGFEYDHIYYEDVQKIKYYKNQKYDLTPEEIDLLNNFIESLTPPSFARQVDETALNPRDLKLDKILSALHYGVFKTLKNICTSLRYESIADVLVAGRVDSKDKYADEARRILEFSDILWNRFYEIRDSVELYRNNEDDIPDIEFFALQMPNVPEKKFFIGDGYDR